MKPCPALLAALLPLVSGIALATDPPREWDSHLQRRDYAGALRILVPAADGGDARAAAVLADIHERGLGGRRDYDQAIRWRRVAAENGDAESAYRIGNQYARGDGVSRSDEMAEQWFRAAAEKGHPQAQLELSKLLARAGASAEEFKESEMWYDRARDNGAVAAAPLPPPAAGTAAERGPTLSDLRAERAMRHGWHPRDRRALLAPPPPLWADPFGRPYGVVPGWSAGYGYGAGFGHPGLWGPGPFAGWGWGYPGTSHFHFGFSQRLGW